MYIYIYIYIYKHEGIRVENYIRENIKEYIKTENNKKFRMRKKWI